MKPILNIRITSLKESSTLAINQKAKAKRAAGETVFHYGFGQSPFPVHQNIQNALKNSTHHKDYLATAGLLELREAICNHYKEQVGYNFTPDQIVIGPGSKELIFQSLFVLEGPLIVPAPSWVSYGPQAHIRGKYVYAVQTKRENGYKLTASGLKDACAALVVNRQKILIINNPNNPTGSVYTDTEVRTISEVAREEGVIIISDEIYHLTDYSGKPFEGFSKHYPEGTIVTGGLSKGHSAGGYRLGFLAAPDNMPKFMKTLCAMISETFSAVSAPTQYAAVTAYTDDEVYRYARECSEIHQATGSYMKKRLDAMGANCAKPEGAFYIFPDFQKFIPKFKKLGIETSMEMCDYFLSQLGIACLPSNDFYCPEDMMACRMATVDYDGAKVYDAFKKERKADDAFVEKYCPHLKNGMDALEKFLKS